MKGMAMDIVSPQPVKQRYRSNRCPTCCRDGHRLYDLSSSLLGGLHANRPTTVLAAQSQFFNMSFLLLAPQTTNSHLFNDAIAGPCLRDVSAPQILQCNTRILSIGVVSGMWIMCRDCGSDLSSPHVHFTSVSHRADMAHEAGRGLLQRKGCGGCCDCASKGYKF